ncbi:MAG TPA: pilus assembly protein TadG-related protein [Candidatus Binatia bacterium]|nr:pilus assembly protein TadG-related protein [Candidatus Binatia bacterium]
MKTARCSNEMGQVLVFTSLMLVILFGFLALAMDVGFFYQHKRGMQTAADSAALAGAHELKRDPAITFTDLETTARGDANSNGFPHGSNSIDVDINRPPASGPYAGQNSFVEAIITHPHRTFFARALNLLGLGNNFNTTTVRARAVAGYSSGQGCIWVLDPDDPKALEVSSGSTINAPSCGIQVNSESDTGLSVTSLSSITAASVNVSQDYNDGETPGPGSTISPAPTYDAPAVTDPMAGMQPPGDKSQACTYTSQVKVEQKTNYTLSPGVYCGGILLTQSTVTFSPGVYILKDGGLAVESGSHVTGSDVTFYNTYQTDPYKAGRIYISSNSSAVLSAPFSTGILFYQDPAIPEDNSSADALIASNISSTSLSGIMYFPKHQVSFESNTTINTGAPWTSIVARKVEVSSGTTLNLNLGFAPALATVRLVE